MFWSIAAGPIAIVAMEAFSNVIRILAHSIQSLQLLLDRY